MSESKPAKPHETVIHVDGQPVKVSETALTGAQIKARAGKDAQYQLFLEMKGNDNDKLVNDGETIKIENGMHFYTVPPATFGTK
jgi:hypothetical protein